MVHDDGALAEKFEGETARVETVPGPGGQPFPWVGFYTGARVMSEDELWRAAARLLGMDRPAVAAAARQALKPFVEPAGERARALILHGATPTTKGFEGDVHDLVNGRHVYDCATYLETRSVYLARPGDVCVGRTEPWAEAVAKARIDHLPIGRRDFYYLSQQLIVLALDRRSGIAGPLDGVVALVRAHPAVVIRLYALDSEMQVFLLWLMREAGLTSLNIDANGPEISDRWNQKAPLHPTVARALAMPRGSLRGTPDALLAEEATQSRLALELAIAIPVLPGYTIERPQHDLSCFVEQTLAAARLFDERYRIGCGCLKPSEAGDGARIVGPLDLADPTAVAAAATDAFRHGDDYLLEPFVDYQRFRVGDRTFIVAPSSHIRYGQVARGLTLQMMKGVTWTGNIFFDKRAAAEFGVDPASVDVIEGAMAALLAGFAGARTASLGLVMAGVDFAIGRIGGLFGDRTIVAAQDLNLSSHGAEYLRSFLDHMRADRGLTGEDGLDGATLVVLPSRQATITKLGHFAHALTRTGAEFRAIASVPGRWAMIACTADTARQSAQGVLEFEEALRHAGYTL